MCFKDFDKKPETCAPSGLNDGNSISYKDYEDLMNKVNNLSGEDYDTLQKNSIEWVKSKSTNVLAEKILKIIDIFYKKQ